MVRAKIGNRAAPILPVMPPIGVVVMHSTRAQHRVVGPLRGGPEPKIPVQLWFGGFLRQIARHSRTAYGDIDMVDFAEHSIADQLTSNAELSHGTLHRPDLEDALLPAHRLDHRARFVNGFAQRLLAVNVLASFSGGN